MASAGWTKNADVPVLESVAAILRAMMPDLPMPVTITRPRQEAIRSTACVKRSSRQAIKPLIAAASVASTLRARARSAATVEASEVTLAIDIDRGRGRSGRRGRRDRTFARDGVEAHEFAQQRFERVEPQRVL